MKNTDGAILRVKAFDISKPATTYSSTTPTNLRPQSSTRPTNIRTYSNTRPIEVVTQSKTRLTEVRTQSRTRTTEVRNQSNTRIVSNTRQDDASRPSKVETVVSKTSSSVTETTRVSAATPHPSSASTKYNRVLTPSRNDQSPSNRPKITKKVGLPVINTAASPGINVFPALAKPTRISSSVALKTVTLASTKDHVEKFPVLDSRYEKFNHQDGRHDNPAAATTEFVKISRTRLDTRTVTKVFYFLSQFYSINRVESCLFINCHSQDTST